MAKRAHGKNGAIDFCKDIGGTTLSMGECASVDRDRQAVHGKLVRKTLFAKLDDDARTLAETADKAWSAYASKEAARASDKFRGGSLRSLSYASTETALEASRTASLDGLFAYAIDAKNDDAAEKKARKTVDDASFADAKGGDAAHRTLVRESDVAWDAFRAAEVALYVKLFRDKLGEPAVTRDVSTRILRARAQALVESKRP